MKDVGSGTLFGNPPPIWARDGNAIGQLAGRARLNGQGDRSGNNHVGQNHDRAQCRRPDGVAREGASSSGGMGSLGGGTEHYAGKKRFFHKHSSQAVEWTFSTTVFKK